MKKKNIVYTIIFLSGIFFLTGNVFADESVKDATMNPYETVAIQEEGLSHEVLIVEPGTQVTWVNLTEAEVEITFLDKEAVDATDCIECFFITDDGFYQSLVLFYEYTASLFFKEEGFYDYIAVVFKPPHGRRIEFRGAVFVH
jgi:plastocyanin